MKNKIQAKKNILFSDKLGDNKRRSVFISRRIHKCPYTISCTAFLQLFSNNFYFPNCRYYEETDEVLCFVDSNSSNC